MYLKHLQCSKLDQMKPIPWINTFLNPSPGTEDVKFVQFINIRSDFTETSTVNEDPKMATFRSGAQDSLKTGFMFNMLDDTRKGTELCKKNIII